MAFRFQLAPQTVQVLSCCPAAVRECVLHELGGLFAGPLLVARGMPLAPEISGTVALRSGFRVCYRLDRAHGLLHLLEITAPSDDAATPSWQ